MPSAPSPFSNTQWSLVGRAAKTTPSGRRALGELFQRYYYPLYAFLRKKGSSQQDAEDLVQTLFGRMSSGRFLDLADQSKGRFRSLLLTSLKNLENDQFKAASRKKRGGDHQFISLESDQAENLWIEEQQNADSPDVAFDRAWVASLLGKAGEKLRGEFIQNGQLELFQVLWERVNGNRQLSNEEIASRFEMTPGAVSSALGRLKKRYANAVRAELRLIVVDEDEINEEIRQLLAIFT